MAGNTRPARKIDALLATTTDTWYKSGAMQDAIFKSNVLFSLLYGKGRVKQETGGHEIAVNLMYGKNNTIKSQGRYSKFNVAPQDGMTTVYYPWSIYSGTVTLDEFSIAVNSGVGRIISLLEADLEQMTMSWGEKLNEHLLDVTVRNAATAAANSPDANGSNILSLPALIYGADPSALDNTIAGLDPNSAGNSWWAAKRQDMTDYTTFAALKRGVSKAKNEIMKGALKLKPNVALGDQTTWELYEASMQDQVRYTQNETGDVGFENLVLKGIPFYWDEMMPDPVIAHNYDDSPAEGAIYLFNTDVLGIRTLAGKDFRPMGWRIPSDADARIQPYVAYLQLVSANRQKGLVMTGIDWDTLETEL